MNKITLSLVMIARNEESVIGQCLDSIKDVVDEMIIIDTGSTDKTREIALKYGAKVVDFVWCDDFSAARNESIKHATSDFLLMLDADETITGESLANLRKIVDRNDKTKVYNVSIENLSDGGDTVKHFNFRLFPNLPQIKFVNPIHEALTFDGSNCTTASADGVVITHYGYLQKHKTRKKTNERNLRILLKALEDPAVRRDHFHYYVAQQYLLEGDYVKSEEHYKKALKLLNDNQCIETAIFTPLVYVGLARIYALTKNIQGMDDLSLISTCTPDLYIELGLFYAEQKKYPKSLDMYEKSISMRYSKQLSCAYDSGSVTWKPYAGMANVYTELNQPIKAIDYYQLALQFQPSNPQLLKVLHDLHVKMGALVEAEEYLAKLIEVKPETRLFINMANLKMNTGKHEEALVLYFKYSNLDMLMQLREQLVTNNKSDLVARVDDFIKQSGYIKKAPYRSSKGTKPFTIIMPTINKAPEGYMKYTLEQLSKSDLVDQILVIDNTEDKSIPEYKGISAPIKYIKDQPNLYANGAWTYGMTLAKSKYYIFINDDILCHQAVLQDCFNVMENDNDIGIVQVSTIDSPIEKYEETVKKLDTVVGSTPYQMKDGAPMMGWFICSRTDLWIPIPSELKFFFGDNITYLQMSNKKKHVVGLMNRLLSHKTSSSVNAMDLYKKGLLESEGKIFQDIYPKLFPNIK